MNFLELCKRVRQETGVSGDGPSSVSGQVGMYKKIVDWVSAAHEEIQVKTTRWRFDFGSFTTTLSAGVEFYDPADVWSLNVRDWDYESMYIYPTADGPGNRTWLSRCDYTTYRHIRMPSVTGRPVHMTWTPDKRVGLYPIPTSGLTIVADYYKRPLVLVNNTDTPRIPYEYHMAIVWRAVMMWASSEENQALYQTSKINFDSVMLKMMDTELLGPMQAEPLA